MSHMTEVKLRVVDLDALAEAAEKVGLELRRGQTTHAWYGRFVGDSRPPAGRDPKDYGKCAHALRLKDHKPGDYEVGLVPALDGKGYDLMLDEWGPGAKLSRAAGQGLGRLKQEYAAAVATKKARATLGRHGFGVTREDLPSGRIRLRLRRR
jgi:hypothetical protein